jgi:hypothetical protein
MSSHFPTVMLALATLGAAPVLAQDNPVVVELYTSQGCSSCPPADDMFRELAQMDGVVALALHVDYWDYIGWKDSFAQPAFTQRQQDYARAAGERTIYTPQLIVGGLDHVVGADGMAVMDHLRAHAAAQSGIVLNVTRDGEVLSIQSDVWPAQSEALIVQIVRYIPEETVSIEQGENAGHTVTYVNIVTAWDDVGRWQVGEPLDLTVPFVGSDPAVVIIQEPGPGHIKAAATLR